ncbi:hypothetical protein EYR41_002444 [Orbilia oligospora]|uniref:Uncharacterized protein n=1 Tax=Orbilia oligospora TaxID=2813651 RepID=A0A8H2DIN7_ORBOL|nr:hypothetical protein EYR41_002444 [Orbilia oligospora]
MSRDLFGEFGDFQSGGTTTTTGGGGSSTTTNNAFSTASSYATQPNASGNSNFDDLLGLFNSPAPAPPSSLSSTTTYPASQFNNNNNNNNNNNVIINNNKSLRPNFQSTTSDAIISGQIFTNTHNSNSNSNYHSNPTTSTTLFTTSPNQNPIFDDDDDDFGDFAVEPLPSTNPTFGPLSNNSPPQKPSIPTILHHHPQEQNKNHDDNNNNEDDDDDFGTFISTPRIPTPPPTFSLSSTITNTNYLHPLHPPPALHALIPLLTTQLLSPSPFLTRLKPLSYPAKQRLLTSVKVKTFFISIIMVSHVVGRIIAGRKIRGRRSYKGKGIENGSNGSNKKNEGLKDEREVGECVREYNEIVGSLRAVVRGMGVVVVELSGEMSISSTTTNTLSSGNKKGKKGSSSNTTTGITEFCWLCGLSPVDKVVKLKEDESIEVGKDIDGGERWVSGWGHRGCRNWWGECGGRFGV